MIRIKEKYLFAVIMLLTLFVTGCSNIRFLAENEVLLNKSKVLIDFKENNIGKRQLKKHLISFSKQQPNERFLGVFKLKLWLFNIANQGKLNRTKNWVKNKMGESPVIFNDQQTESSCNVMNTYLFNKGFFHSEVYFIVSDKKQKAKVTYYVTTNNRYTINKIAFPKDENRMNRIINADKSECLIISGEPYDIDQLQKERERIVDKLKNSGYYYFNKEFVHFEVDSFDNEKMVDIAIQIHQSPNEEANYPYYINHIYVYPEFTDAFKQSYEKDTLLLEDYYFVTYKGKQRLKVLSDAIFLRSRAIYTKDNYELTQRRLLDIGNYKFVNIRFLTVDNEENARKLNCHIYLTPVETNEISVESELSTNTRSHSDYPLGTALNLSYKTRNLFRNADLFTVNLQGGVEMQFGDSLLFNTVDIAPQVNLYFPKFLLPFRLKNLSKNFNPKTRISLGYNFLKREGSEAYAINLINSSFAYDWMESDFKRHIFAPIAVSFVNLNENSTSIKFYNRLKKEPLLRSRFEEIFIIGSNYTFIYNNQRLNKLVNYFYFRGNLDLAGNLLNGINNLVSKNRNAENQLLSVNYSQYIRADADLRYYQVFSKDRIFISRLTGGIGYPLGNSTVLPYVKQFYIGGANSVRAWRIRALGPGSFNSSTKENIFIDQTADIRIESNLEYRFGIFSLLKGALFIDCGNMWTLKEDTLRSGAKFNDDFLQELAIGTGAGIRLDFTYFIVRFDVAIPIKNPVLPKDNRWLLDRINFVDPDWRRSNLIYNLAIGYPF